MAHSRKPHPSEIFDAKRLGAATGFSAHYRAGPASTTTVPCGSAEEALAKAEEMTRELGRFGRRACAYAIMPTGGAVMIDRRLLDLAAAL